MNSVVVHYNELALKGKNRPWFVHVLVQNIRTALAELKRAVALVGDDPVIHEHLGEIYLKQQKLSEAKEAWLHSLELDPSNDKLFQRFREQGLGDPANEDRIQQAKRRVSEKIQSKQSTQ